MTARVLLAILCVACAGCGKEEMEDFVDDLMHPEYNVDYADEGKIFVLINHCLEHADEARYRACSMSGPDSAGLSVQVIPFTPDRVAQVLPYAREYRWITVNPSFSSLEGGILIASTQLKIMKRRGVVLVYLPQGPDRTRVDYTDYDSRWHEANRYMCGGYKQDFPVFQSALNQLVDGVTQPTAGQDGVRPAPRSLIVSAYSYSVHQTLEVVRDKPRVFFVNVAPSFGMQQWRGSPDHDISSSDNDCMPYGKIDSFHELDFEKYPNPHVKTYIDNLATSTVRQCILVSYGDCTSLSFRGMTLTDYAKLGIGCKDQDPPPEIVRGWDPMSPHASTYTLMPPNVIGPTLFTCADPARWDDDACWSFNEQALSPHYGSDTRILEAINANLATNDRIRLFGVMTPSKLDDTTWEQTLTDEFGENAWVGHMGYWMNGGTPDLLHPPLNIEEVTANWHIKDVLAQCTAAFPPDTCPECEDAGDWSNSRNPEPGTDIWWQQEPRIPEDPTRAPDRVMDNDIVYVPVNKSFPETLGAGSLPQAQEEMRLKWGPAAEEKMHISALQNQASFWLYTVPPAARGVARVLFLEDAWFSGTVMGTCTSTSPQTLHSYEFGFPRVLEPANVYSDLVGAWSDVQIRWWDDLYGSCAPPAMAHGSGRRRVLVMKLEIPQETDDGVFLRALREPIPDIRDVVVPPDTEADVLMSFLPTIYVPAAARLTSVTANMETSGGTVTLTHEPLGRECAGGDCMRKGTYEYHRFTGSARDVWCTVHGADALCGGTALRTTPVLATLRIEAFNGEGHEFRQTWTMRIERCEDCDGDGVTDTSDTCLSSILGDTVVIGTCDSGVRNTVLANGCTTADVAAAELAAARNPGAFVSGMAHRTKQLRLANVLSAREAAAIKSCAARGRLK